MTDPNDILHALLRRKLNPFIIKLFEILESGTDFCDNWHIKHMAFHLQQCVMGKCTRLIIAIGPRYLKSFCASVAMPIWIIGRQPTAKIICVSYSDDLSLHFSLLRRTALASPFIKLLFPKLRISKKKNTEKEVVTTKGGYIYSTSVGGTVTGRGADYLIIDDPIKPDEVMSEVERTKVNNWYHNTAFSRLNNKNTGRIIIVSQRVHHDDLIGHLLEIDPNGWTVVEIPAIAEEDRDYIIGEDEYYFRKAGEPLHAQLESLEILENIKTSVGSFVFQSQYQQNPMPPGGVLFKNDWFPRYKKTPFLKSFDRIVESWDTASSIGSDAAYSACTTWGERGNKRTLLCCQRHRLEFPDLLRVIQSSARAHWAHAILIENKSSGQQAIQSLRGKNLNIIPIQPVGDKESRALQASAIIEAGRVEIPQEAPWLPEYLDELLKFPHCKYKDQVDSTVQYLLWAEKRHLNSTFA